MRFITHSLTPAEFQPGDDIDKLFSKLPSVELPDKLIVRILSHIRRQPEPAPSLPVWPNRKIKALVIRNE